MKTPFFLISEEVLNKNIKDFQDALSQYWTNSILSYSVKTNSLPWLLKYLQQKNIAAETVSDEEYQLSRRCGFSDNEIIFNGPIKGEQQFADAMKKGAYINLDSKNDLVYLGKYATGDGSNIGIRINIDPEKFDKDDIGYVEDGFRFGFSDQAGDLSKVLQLYRSIWPKGKPGLHLHCNSVTRSLKVYQTIADYAAKLIKKYNLKLSYLDIGGGFFGGVEGKPTPENYIKIVKEALKDVMDERETTLIVEPGSAIIGSAIDLYTSVLDVKDTSHVRVVTTDGSRIHIDPLWKKNKYMYSLETKSTVFKQKQLICGYTCMDHDRLMVLKDQRELQTGDRIVYHRVGAYSVTFGGMFIRYFPDVYVKHDNTIEKVREHISVDNYLKIQSKSYEV